MESSLADKGAAIEAKKTQINYLQSQLGMYVYYVCAYA